MQQRPGTFIVIEGTDGSGKGTQFEILCERLRLAGYQVATFDFPQYDSPSSYFVRQYLNGVYGDAKEVGPYTASLFYALDRYEAAAEIKEALRSGKVVISNRFTGSSMAHQGTKFRSPEERRGYFIWLDNLEFEMLKIPRPDISFVLRVPADIAQTLVDQKAPRSYTKEKRDIHEADLSHLEKSVEVYDDLTQLFPKDFQRIDCIRSGKLLDREAVQALLWEKIAPLLPPPPQLEMAMPTAQPIHEESAHPENSMVSTEVLDTSTTELAFSLPSGSRLLAQRLDIEADPNYAVTYEQKGEDGKYLYYVPPELKESVAELYRSHMDALFDLYSEILIKLTAHLVTATAVPEKLRDAAWEQELDQEAREIAQAVLPLAASANIPVSASAVALEKQAISLLTNELPEARKAGELLLSDLQTKAPELLQATAFAEHVKGMVAYRATIYAKTKKLAQERLRENHAAETTSVQLSDIWPRNEIELVPEMLYEYSGLPLKTLREEVSGWPYDQKLEVFEAYIGKRRSAYEQPGNALHAIRYTWDLISSYTTYCEVRSHCVKDSTITQPLTPRYGYDVPDVIDEAGLVDQFEECFAISLKLYSLLQQEGYEREAQYATLLGHKLRWQLRITAADMFHLFEVGTKPSSHPLLRSMHIRLSEAHPLLADCMRFNAATAAPAAPERQHA